MEKINALTKEEEQERRLILDDFYHSCVDSERAGAEFDVIKFSNNAVLKIRERYVKNETSDIGALEGLKLALQIAEAYKKEVTHANN